MVRLLAGDTTPLTSLEYDQPDFAAAPWNRQYLRINAAHVYTCEIDQNGTKVCLEDGLEYLPKSEVKERLNLPEVDLVIERMKGNGGTGAARDEMIRRN